jgi:alkylation response protein AidB-like acyl-CoA dehydrogenase
MNFELTDEEQAFQAAVRRFGDRVLRPNETKIDTEGRIPPEVLAAMADLGLLAMPVPT